MADIERVVVIAFGEVSRVPPEVARSQLVQKFGRQHVVHLQPTIGAECLDCLRYLSTRNHACIVSSGHGNDNRPRAMMRREEAAVADDADDVAGETDRETSLQWLREPPGAGEVRVFVECGDGAELSEEARQALEQLMEELSQAEVAGYMQSLGDFNVGLSSNIFSAVVQIDYRAGGKCGKKSG